MNRDETLQGTMLGNLLSGWRFHTCETFFCAQESAFKFNQARTQLNNESCVCTGIFPGGKQHLWLQEREKLMILGRVMAGEEGGPH